MLLEFRDLGYVKQVEIDLSKNLTILCGPNGTGKTYVAYAIYGLMKHRSESKRIKKIADDLKDIMISGQVDFDVIELLTHGRSSVNRLLSESYIHEIYNVFASDPQLFKKTELDISLGDLETLRLKIKSQKVSREIKLRNMTIQLEKDLGSLDLKCLVILSEEKDRLRHAEIPLPVILDFISARIFDILLDFILPNTYIAPAERIAINIFSKELSLKRNVLVDKLLELKNSATDDDPFDMINRRATRYPSLFEILWSYLKI